MWLFAICCQQSRCRLNDGKRINRLFNTAGPGLVAGDDNNDCVCAVKSGRRKWFLMLVERWFNWDNIIFLHPCRGNNLPVRLYSSLALSLRVVVRQSASVKIPASDWFVRVVTFVAFVQIGPSEFQVPGNILLKKLDEGRFWACWVKWRTNEKQTDCECAKVNHCPLSIIVLYRTDCDSIFSCQKSSLENIPLPLFISFSIVVSPCSIEHCAISIVNADCSARMNTWFRWRAQYNDWQSVIVWEKSRAALFSLSVSWRKHKRYLRNPMCVRNCETIPNAL